MPKLNVIYDARRSEKYEPLINELNRQNIEDYEIWPCIMQNDVISSINASHKMIVRMAAEHGLEEVFIAEDDIWFPADDGWEYFLKNKPSFENYDLYLAATYIPEEKPSQVCGFHLYSVSSRFYEDFLSVPNEDHIDTAMNKLRGEYVFCYPFAALQRAGFSSNNKSVVNYNSVLKDGDVYGFTK